MIENTAAPPRRAALLGELETARVVAAAAGAALRDAQAEALQAQAVLAAAGSPMTLEQAAERDRLQVAAEVARNCRQAAETVARDCRAAVEAGEQAVAQLDRRVEAIRGRLRGLPRATAPFAVELRDVERRRGALLERLAEVERLRAELTSELVDLAGTEAS